MKEVHLVVLDRSYQYVTYIRENESGTRIL